MDKNVREIVIQDVTMAMVPADGVAADLSHLDFKPKVSAFSMDPKVPAVQQLRECLT